MNFTDNFTMRDIAGASLALLLFIPVLLAPGYVLAWFTGVLSFRRITSPWKLLVSLPLSVAACPIATYWTGFNGSWTPVFVFYGVCFTLFLSLLAGIWRHEALPSWLRGFRSVPRAGWIIPAAWLVIVIASLADLQIQNRLYLSITDADHLTRATITGAIARYGVRPPNPFFHLSLAPLRYHYFWFILCGFVKLLSGSFVTSQQAIIASVIWCGWALFALVPLFLRFFQGMTGAILRRRSLLAICLFSLTGLDLLPNLLRIALLHRVFPDIEWWNEQVASWLASLLWVPHSVAALIACLTGFLVLWNAALRPSPRRYFAAGTLAGAAFASGTGISIYVTLVFVFILIVWGAITILRRWWNHTIALVVAGVISLVLVFPYLHSLGGPGAAGGSFVSFDIRQFSPIDMLAARLTLGKLPHSLLRFAALPLNYFLELGFFGVVAALYLWRLPKLRSETGQLPAHVVAAVTIMAVSVMVCTFIRSGVIAANDLGWRGFLPAQFIMLLWAADLMAERGSRSLAQGNSFHNWWLRSPAWAALILVGLAGTVYEAVVLRTYLVATDAGLLAPGLPYSLDRRFGERAWELRRAFEYLDRTLPPDALVQSNPDSPVLNFYDYLYSNRGAAVSNGDGVCGAVMGGDPTPCAAGLAAIGAIFDRHPGNASESWRNVQEVARGYSINALVVTDFDPAWQSENSWVGQVTPAFSEQHVRAYLVNQPTAPK